MSRCLASYPGMFFCRAHACKRETDHLGGHQCECSFCWTPVNAKYPGVGKRTGRVVYTVVVSPRFFGPKVTGIRFIQDITVGLPPQEREVVMADDVVNSKVRDLTHDLKIRLGYRLVRAYTMENRR